MSENLPPLPGTPEPPTRSLTAYVLRGDAWVEIGSACAHPDGRGHRLTLYLAPEDGDVIELRATDSAFYPAAEAARIAPNKRSRRKSAPRARLTPRGKS